jgi:hypothetical protein
VLERLKRGIFSKRTKVATRLGATMQEPMEIQDSSDENDKEAIVQNNN